MRLSRPGWGMWTSSRPSCGKANNMEHSTRSGSGSIVELVEQEVARARSKFAAPTHTLLATHEEVGELTRAVLRYQLERAGTAAEVQKELIQSMAMLLRLWEEGDQSLNLSPIRDLAAPCPTEKKTP